MKKRIKLKENAFDNSRWMEIIEEIHRLATELKELANEEDISIMQGELDLRESAQRILAITSSLGGGLGFSNKMKCRLTESQLKQIISESVKQVLNELDPRTYASYADKREKQGRYDKAQVGKDAAAQAWTNKYGEYDVSDGTELGMRSTKHRGPSKYFVKGKKVTAGYNPNTDEYWRGENKYTYNPRIDRIWGKEDGYTDRDYDGYTSWRVLGSGKDEVNRLTNNNPGIDVATQMANGTGKYVKGKGWQ